MDDELAALRAEVDRRAGPARTQPLAVLGRALTERYWRVGPGQPSALPYLDEAVRAFDEAYGYLEPEGFLRGQIACMLGWLVGIRHTAHGSSVADRERAIPLLDEALEYPQLPAVQQTMAKFVLAQLLMSRAAFSLQSPALLTQMMSAGVPPEAKRSADRAVRCLREVVTDSGAVPDVVPLAQTMLDAAEGLQDMLASLGGGVLNLDMNRLMQSMAKMQAMQQQARTASRGTGFGRMPNPFDFGADALAMADPRKRPVAVAEGPIPAPTTPPTTAPTTTAPAPVAPAPAEPPAPSSPQAQTNAARDAYLDLVPGRTLSGLLELLDRDATGIDVQDVDAFAARAGALVRDVNATGTDHLMLAVALYLRGVVDPGGGWDADDDVDDLRGARESLFAAADLLADTLSVALRLAKRLDERQPEGKVRDRLAACLTDVLP